MAIRPYITKIRMKPEFLGLRVLKVRNYSEIMTETQKIETQ